MNKPFIKYFFLFVTVLFIGIVSVKAKSVCDGAEYQCIMCKYEATGVNKNAQVTFYAKADGTGGVILSSEGNLSGYITWSIGVNSSDFINSNKNGMICSDKIYVKDDKCGNAMCYSVSSFGDNKSTLIESTDNKKPFTNPTSETKTTYCNNIPMYLLGAGVLDGGSGSFNDKNYSKIDKTSTLIKRSDGTYDIELPATYNKASSDWNQVSSDLINKCDSAIIVTCYSSQKTGYQSSQTVYHCSLQTTEKLKDRTEVGDDGRKIPSTLPTPTPLNPPDIPEASCTSLFGDPGTSGTPAYYLTYAFKIARYVAIVLLVVLSIMDFIESTSSQDQDSINKAINKTIKRLVLCVIIFLLPSFIEFILTMLNDRAANVCINY